MQKISGIGLKKKSYHIFDQFLKEAEDPKNFWISLAVNKSTFNESERSKELEIHTLKGILSLKIAENQNEYFFKFWKNKKVTGSTTLSTQSSSLSKFNDLIDHLLKKEIANFQHELNLNLATTQIQASEMAQDEKALEWIRVTFKILEKAIIESFKNQDYLFQALLFFGLNPKNSEATKPEIRLIIFNLDIKFTLLENRLLRVQIFDDKAAYFGSSQKAVLEGDFNFRKREMFDELINLIAVCSRGLKIS
jgi:hypothetical protein